MKRNGTRTVRRLRNPEREAERHRRHDDDDSTGEISEPLFAGDIVREVVARLSLTRYPDR